MRFGCGASRSAGRAGPADLGGFDSGLPLQCILKGVSSGHSSVMSDRIVLGGGTGGGDARIKAVPDDDLEGSDLEPSGPSSPKRGKDRKPERASKRRGGEGADVVPALDLAQMERLLEAHSTRILKAQKDNLEGMMSIFEQQTAEKLSHIEAKAEQADQRSQNVEARLEQMQSQLNDLLKTKPATQPEVDRRYTLVFGGWQRDTRRQVILQQLKEGLERLDLVQYMDSEAFCTGPRRSTALAVFYPREKESEYMVRRRMHQVIMGLAKTHVAIPEGRRLFATYSKSRAERAIAGHAGWLKRTLTAMGAEYAGLLDLEYATGTCWVGTSIVASATRPSEPGVDERHLIRDEVEGNKVWVNVVALANELGRPQREMVRMLEEHKR